MQPFPIEKLYVECLCRNELVIDMSRVVLSASPDHSVECSRCQRILYLHMIMNEKQQGTPYFRMSFEKPRTVNLICCSECGSRNIKVNYTQLGETQHIIGIECFDCQDADMRTSHCPTCVPKDGCAHLLETTVNPEVLRCTHCGTLFEITGEKANRKLRHLKDGEGRHLVDKDGKVLRNADCSPYDLSQLLSRTAHAGNPYDAADRTHPRKKA